MAWVAAIPAIASVAGDLIQGSQANTSSKAAREFEQQMSDTAVQRHVVDMKAAGVNPMLAGINQSQASTPTATPAAVPDYGRDIGSGVSSAMDAYQKSAQRVQMTLENANLQKQGQLLDAQTANAIATNSNIAADTQVKTSQLPLNASVTNLNAHAVGKVDADTLLTTNSADNALKQHDVLNAQFGEINAHIAEIMQSVRGKQIDNETQSLLQPYVLQLGRLEATRAQLGMPKLENESAAQDSWWMKNLSPYLPDILKSSGAAAGAGSAIRSIR